jgi:hypothetical protein
MAEKHKGNPARDAGAEFARVREQFPPYGEVIEVEYASESGTKVTPHGMGRRFSGTALIGQDTGVRYVRFSPTMVAALGYDPAVEFAIDCSTSHSGTATVWVF